MRYTIDDNNTVRMFKDGEDVPFLLQPDWPDMTPWASLEEAQAWAEAKLIELTDETQTSSCAGDGPSEPLKPRPIDPKKSAMDKLASYGLTQDEILAIINS